MRSGTDTDERAQPVFFGSPREADVRLWTAAAPAPAPRPSRAAARQRDAWDHLWSRRRRVSGGIWYLVVTATKYQVIYRRSRWGVLVGKANRTDQAGHGSSTPSSPWSLRGWQCSPRTTSSDRHVLVEQSSGRMDVCRCGTSFRFARALVSAGFDANPSGKRFYAHRRGARRLCRVQGDQRQVA